MKQKDENPRNSKRCIDLECVKALSNKGLGKGFSKP